MWNGPHLTATVPSLERNGNTDPFRQRKLNVGKSPVQKSTAETGTDMTSLTNSVKLFIPKTFPTSIQVTIFKHIRFTLETKQSI